MSYSNFTDLTEKGRHLLREYLEEKGVNIVRQGSTEFFRCIHPDHEDKNPSSGFVRRTNDRYFHCFSCGCSGDIYTAAALLEGKPLYGLGFVKNNLEFILDKYKIDYDPVEVSEEKLAEIKLDTVYESTYQLMTDWAASDLLDDQHLDLSHARTRGWKGSICREIGVGSVKDYNVFLRDLSKKTCLPEEYLQTVGIRDDLFGPDLLTFCIRDHKGVVKGFVARYTDWEKNCGQPKYRNTSMDDNPFYRKDQILFGLNIAKRFTSLRLDIFEGYGSLVTAQQNNHRNCVAIGGTALTDNHVELIADLGFTHINLVLDQDTSGTEQMDRYLEKFGGRQGLTVTCMHLPITDEELKVEGQNDPDYYINTHGIAAYRLLKPIGAFELLVSKHSEGIEPGSIEATKFCQQLVPLLINEADHIERGRMIHSLSDLTGVDREDIKDEVQRIEQTNVRGLTERIQRDLRNARNPDDLHEILARARGQLENTASSKRDRFLLSTEESVQTFDEIFSDMDLQDTGIHGWKTGYMPLDDMLDGIQRPGKLGGIAIGFAGAPQHAKSATMLNFSLQIARRNEDVSILFWAIDDNRRAIAYKLVSMLSGVSMRKVRRLQSRAPWEDRAIKDAQIELRDLMARNILLFKDDKLGRSKQKAETWIKSVQDLTGNDVLFCVDSLHNVGTEVAAGEERVGVKRVSGWLKTLCTSVPCTVMATLELVKNREGRKPTLTSIMESGKMEFDFDTLAIVWNEVQGLYTSINNPTVLNKWLDPNTGKYNPVIELDFQKNKSSAGEKGQIFFKFDARTTAFVGCTRHLEITEEQIDVEVADDTTFAFTSTSAGSASGKTDGNESSTEEGNQTGTVRHEGKGSPGLPRTVRA